MTIDALQFRSLTSPDLDFIPILAILMTPCKTEIRHFSKQKIFISSHSKAATQVIFAPRTKLELIQECGYALGHLARQKEFTLLWVPGHTGIPGYEIADELVRRNPLG
ncbi:hypothetical protein NQ317_014171 [Molorchus minor]|uniref:RNase H type-1 domain-containing protein n=1 Tax=Molorchus minor TaxID=1323400 RepID=A0ABQ9J0S1_9CUCU|nr:hypothetical protein NQ317_014171 [Molorchus minor]